MATLTGVRRLHARAARRWARWQRARRFERLVARGGRRDYLFVSGPGGDARRYRCDHQAEQLRLCGRTADVGYRDELDLERLAAHYGCVVLYRVPWDEGVERLLAAARRGGTRVLADVDDLVFDAAQIDLLHDPSLEPPEARASAIARMEGLRRTLEAVDGVVTSTDPLAAVAAEVNDDVTVTYNVVSAAMVEASRRARVAAPRRDGNDVVVAYFSGTPTHDRDVSEAADALEWTLRRHPSVRLWTVGPVTLDSRLHALEERVVQTPYQPWSRLPRLVASADISLAPLEAANAFTEAKSCLKYLEAALLGVPTIASSRSDFRRAIDDGVNGRLADDPATWREALESLVESPHTRTRIGAAALDDVLAKHTTGARAVETARAFAAAGGGAAE